MTSPPITTPAHKFPLPFANRRPRFVPHSIDPKRPLKTYDAWCDQRPSIFPRYVPWAVVGVLAVFAGISWAYAS